MAHSTLHLKRTHLAMRRKIDDAISPFGFSAMSVVTPARLPGSTSAFLIHSLSVCAEQPTLAAMEEIAAQRDGCSAS